MRILYHHRTASRDGQAVHIDELIDAFGRAGHEVTIVGPAAGEEMEFGGENRMIAALKKLLPGAAYELLELGYSFLTYWRLRREVRKFAPDLYYERYNLFSPAGAWLRRRYRLPFLLEVNAPLAEERQRYGQLRLRRLARWSERYAWRNADRVLPVTEVLAGYVRDAGVPDERIVVIPNGINRERFDSAGGFAARRAEFGLENAVVLGFTGFIRDWHGLDDVIDALPGLGDNVHLMVVGDGPGRRALEAQAGRLGLQDRVHFTGLVERDEVAGYVGCFDIALQPAVTAYASPLKIFEYMAMGCAIVAPRLPNIEEVLDDESAMLFDPEHEGARHDAIARLCNDATLRERLSAGARRQIAVRRLTWDDNAAKIAALTDEVRAGLQ